MNRAEKARAVVLFEELATALRAELFGEAAHEHGQGSTPTWRMGEVTVSSSLSNPTVVIDDQAAFLAYVQATYPTEVEEIVTTTVQIRPHFAKDVLTRLAKSGATVDHEGTVVPGLRFVPGGNLRSIAVKPTAEFKAEATRFALEVAAGQRPLALPSITDEPLPVEAPAEVVSMTDQAAFDLWADLAVEA